MRNLFLVLLLASQSAKAAPMTLPDFEIVPSHRTQSSIDGGRGVVYSFNAWKVDRKRDAVIPCRVNLYVYSGPGGQAPQLEANCNKPNPESPRVKGAQFVLEPTSTNATINPGFWFIDAVNGAVTYCNSQITAAGIGKSCTTLQE